MVEVYDFQRGTDSEGVHFRLVAEVFNSSIADNSVFIDEACVIRFKG